MKRKVLVLGSTGAMGQYIVPYLADMGYQVTAVSLDDEVPYNEQVTCIKGNAKDMEFLKGLLSQNFDGVVDFMIYHKRDFIHYYKLFLENTKHYIFLSSCRVYANEEIPVKETSPRLLDVSTDEKLLASNDYCIHKAKAENLLFLSGYDNWTIVRPATTFSKMRYQLVTLEAHDTVGRAVKGKKVVLPLQAKDKPATLCWAGDVSMMIAKLLFNEKAKKEVYNVCSSEHRTWEEIAGYYKEIAGLEAVWVDKEDYLKILNPDMGLNTRWQLEYARMFDRITDNSKVLEVTGMKQEELTPLYDALKMMIEAVPEGYEFPDTDLSKRMDEYIKDNNLN
ncbi:MAG: NAD-dependent epimerase/dehydratase family protein [Clostridia bacterium]|nr:NAD-dependent epimerase/dehydratase family protein [Clostridia bacterium]